MSDQRTGGTDAERAAAAAERAADAAEQAADHRDSAAEHRESADTARADATKARDDAADARATAAGARDEAAQAEDDAEEARDDARDARGGAEEALAGAERAGAEAEVAAEAARGLADLPASDPVVNPDVRAEEAGVDEANPLGRPGRPMNRRSPFRIGFAGALGVGFAYLLYQAVVSARSVLVLVIVAAFLAIGLNPIVTRLERTGMRRGAAVGIVFAGVLAFFALFGYAVLPPVITQVTNFVESLPNYVRDLAANPR